MWCRVTIREERTSDRKSTSYGRGARVSGHVLFTREYESFDVVQFREDTERDKRKIHIIRDGGLNLNWIIRVGFGE